MKVKRKEVCGPQISYLSERGSRGDKKEITFGLRRPGDGYFLWKEYTTMESNRHSAGVHGVIDIWKLRWDGSNK